MTRGARHRQGGAALLIAMVLLTLVATLASGMLWQQWRAVQVEIAVRARTQATWIVTGAQDWARLILREDHRADVQSQQQKGQAIRDHLGEPWATPLQESRLDTFLALDQNNNTEDGPAAFLSGGIVDAQSRYNLRNLVDAGQLVPAQVASLERLCTALALPSDTAQVISQGLLSAWNPQTSTAPIAPQRVADLVWLGVDATTVERLKPMVELLPVRTPVNLNTAPREVMAAVVAGLDLGSAERLVNVRQSNPFDSLPEAQKHMPATVPALDPKVVSVSSSFFEIRGRMRLEDRVLEERSIVERRGADVVTLLRERQSQIQAPR